MSYILHITVAWANAACFSVSSSAGLRKAVFACGLLEVLYTLTLVKVPCSFCLAQSVNVS